MSDTLTMISLLAFLAVTGAVGALAVRHGADSRKDDGRPNW
jgi:hypothetical protein